MQEASERSVSVLRRLLSGTNLKARSSPLIIGSVVLICAVAATAPFFFSHHDTEFDGHRTRRIVTTHDLGMHLYTMDQFDKGLRSGVAYPRWVPDINHGYGILTLIYYPPGFFYLTSAVHVLVKDWLDGLFILSTLALAASGLALYLVARRFYSLAASLCASIFYMLLPLHMTDLYWRGSLPQFVGYIFPPLAMLFGYRLVRDGGAIYYAGFALAYGSHLLINLPVSLMFTYALAFFLVVWSVKERDWRIGARLATAMCLGLLVSAIYWLPAALASKYSFEYATAIFPYDQSYVTLLPVGDTAQYLEFGQVIQDVFTFNALAIIVFVLVLRWISRSHRHGKVSSNRWTPLSMWIVMAIATAFMSSSYSIYISRLLPKIQITVPAWRWLALSGMFVSLILARTIDALRHPRSLSPRALWLLRASVLAVVCGSLWISIRESIIQPLGNAIYNPGSVESVIEAGWTPKGSTRPEELPDNERVLTSPDGAAVEIARWDPQLRVIHIKADRVTTARLKTYNFPGWTARIDGKMVPMSSDGDGIQQVEVPPGIHTIEASFENTLPMTAGGVLSAVGLLAIAGLALAGRLKPLGGSAAAAPEDNRDRPHDLRKPVYARPRTLVVIALLVIIPVVILLITRRRGSDRTIGATGGGVAGAKPQAMQVSAGSEARLRIANREWIPVATEQRALVEVLAAIASRDDAASEALANSGKIYKVENNTRVRVLETSLGAARVRILDGNNAMVEGWVSERWLN